MISYHSTFGIEYFWLFFNIYIIVKTFRCQKKSILQLIVLAIHWITSLRMEVIEYYQESEGDSSIITMDDKYKHLSQNGILFNYDGQVFSFPIMTTDSMYEGCFIIYAEKEEELTKYISRIYSKKEILQINLLILFKKVIITGIILNMTDTSFL